MYVCEVSTGQFWLCGCRRSSVPLEGTIFSLLGAGLSCLKFLVISLIHLSLGPESAMPVPRVA
jgi:hypothetical protein